MYKHEKFPLHNIDTPFLTGLTITKFIIQKTSPYTEKLLWNGVCKID